jgi:Zn-dependent peptidase ImmA (M78 family)
MPQRHVGRARAERAAQEILDEQKIRRPPIDVERIAAGLNISVVYEPLASDTSAVLIREPDGSQHIGVNALHSATRRRFSVAHELGHARLHFRGQTTRETEAVFDRPLEMMFRDGTASEGSNRLEIDANAFAAALLMPADMIKSELRRVLQDTPEIRIDSATDTLAHQFGVSAQAMRFRLVNLGLLDPV